MAAERMSVCQSVSIYDCGTTRRSIFIRDLAVNNREGPELRGNTSPERIPQVVGLLSISHAPVPSNISVSHTFLFPPEVPPRKARVNMRDSRLE